MAGIEAKLDLLLKQANVKFEPYANLPAGVAEAIQSGEKIKAIKLYREASGVGLKEAKDFIEGVQGRYFLPLAPAAALLSLNRRWARDLDRAGRWLFGAAVFTTAVTLVKVGLRYYAG